MYVRYSAIFYLELYRCSSEYILEKDVCSVMSVLVSASPLCLMNLQLLNRHEQILTQINMELIRQRYDIYFDNRIE